MYVASSGRTPLLSTASATGRPALFGRFFDTTGLSDSSSLFIVGYAFRLPSAPHVAVDRGEAGGLPDSSKVFPHMHGVSDPGCPSPSRLSTRWILPSACPDDVGASNCYRFRGSLPSLCLPLSTLRPQPRDCQRMTQGRGGLLGLPRMALPSTTLLPAHWRLPGLNTRPARTPTNASWPALRLTPHSSGPAWIASPSPYDSCIRYTSPLIPAQPPSRPHPPLEDALRARRRTCVRANRGMVLHLA